MAACLHSRVIFIGLVVGLGLITINILSPTGPGAVPALLSFIAGLLAIGYVLGGRDPGIRSVMGLCRAKPHVPTVIVAAAPVDRGHPITSRRREDLDGKSY